MLSLPGKANRTFSSNRKNNRAKDYESLFLPQFKKGSYDFITINYNNYKDYHNDN